MPEYSPGGRALDFTSSLNINLRRGDWIKIGSGANANIVGQQVKFKISKSKVSVPYKSGMYDFYIDEGGVVPQGHIDTFKEVVLESVAYGIVNRGGAWFNYQNLKVQGADNLVAELRNNLDLYEEIREATLAVALDEHEGTYKELVEAGEINPNEESLEEASAKGIKLDVDDEEVTTKPKPSNNKRKAKKVTK